MRRVPLRFIGESPDVLGRSNKFRAISRRYLGERVMTAPVRRFCLYGSSRQLVLLPALWPMAAATNATGPSPAST